MTLFIKMLRHPGIENEPNGKENPTNIDTQVVNADDDIINSETSNPVTNTAKEIAAGIDEPGPEDESTVFSEDDLDEEDGDDAEMDEEELDEEDAEEEDNNTRDAFNNDMLKAGREKDAGL